MAANEKQARGLWRAPLLLFSILVLAISAAVMKMLKMQQVPQPESRYPDWLLDSAGQSHRALAVACSGHGRVYEDTVGLTCECNPCYQGADCSHLTPDCVVDADSGDPTFLESFWEQRGAGAGVFVPSWYRMSYTSGQGGSNPLTASAPLVYLIQNLENRIRELHELVGNAITKDRYLVLGTGSMQLVAAAVNALSDGVPEKPALVVSRAPYYMIYKLQIETLSSSKFVWRGDAVEASQDAAVDSSSVIELVASPNNPDTAIQDAVFKGTKAKVIHDYAYYWPHYKAITGAADEDVMLFSLSKATGHAGSRIGWAIVKDLEIAKKMMFYIIVTTIGVSHESQLRASKLVGTILQTYQTDRQNDSHVFHFAHQLLQTRWKILLETFSGSKRFSIQKFEPEHCLFFNREVLPGPAYVWIKCEQPGDSDCFGVFKAAGILGRPGRSFGVEDRYLRLSVIKHDDHFDLLVQQLKKLIGQERAN